MGNVSVIYRVLPQDVETNIEKIMEEVKSVMPKDVTLRGMQVKDVAFGLKEVLVAVLMKDEGGKSDEIEKLLGSIPGVGSVDVLDLTLV
ncbi:MAG: elongation factor 1-beta [Thermoplasmata archaeon]|nr:elongation factor 1-beta [Thermoplasmata archaeon]